MAAELLMVAGRRRVPGEPHPCDSVADESAAAAELRQFVREDGALRPRSRAVPSAERCPVAALQLDVAG
jgi:hypothetical protein